MPPIRKLFVFSHHMSTASRNHISRRTFWFLMDFTIVSSWHRIMCLFWRRLRFRWTMCQTRHFGQCTCSSISKHPHQSSLGWARRRVRHSTCLGPIFPIFKFKMNNVTSSQMWQVSCTMTSIIISNVLLFGKYISLHHSHETRGLRLKLLRYHRLGNLDANAPSSTPKGSIRWLSLE